MDGLLGDDSSARTGGHCKELAAVVGSRSLDY